MKNSLRLNDGDGTAVSSQKKIQPPPVQSGRKAAAAAAKVSDVVERRHRRGASRRRCKFSALSVRRRSAGDRGMEEEDDGVG
jgi:hypothetical protein